MNANENVTESEKPQQGLDSIVEEKSKQSFRKKVWEYLEKNKLVSFPRPVFGRIPNFKGTEKAAARLLDLEEFQAAKAVEIDPDKPLEASRMVVIDRNKILYVPGPNMQEGLLTKLSFCTDDKPKNIRQVVTRWGINTLGKTVGFGEGLHIDLIVLGSVAVSKEGRRIGKGRGYADLEYAILKEMKAVDDNTIIVTTVHDCQVFDSLPADIFQNYDVPVDYILTPTETIKVEKKLPRPEGIYWDVLSQRKLDLIPILQQIKGDYQSEAQENTIVEKENEDANVASGEKQEPGTNPKPRLSERNRISNYAENPRKQRFFQRSRSANVRIENEDLGNKENSDSIPFMKNRQRPFRRNTHRYKVDFSLVVSNIDKNVRVRQLKDVLIDHGIRPSNITWRGYKGFCYLHYAKPVKKEEKTFAIDNIVETLKTLKLNPDSSNLRVKIMEPTRIETTGVTAV